MYDYILVPLDGSTLAECVLPHAKAMAKLNGAHVVLMRVLDRCQLSDEQDSVDPLDWQIRKAEAATYMEVVAERLADAGIELTIEILEGNAAESILEYADLHDVSLILLSSHGQSGLTGWNVSGVVQKVIQRARTSILMVRAYTPAALLSDDVHYQRILVPLDGSQRAESVLPSAIALARSPGTHLLITHVVREPEMPRRTPLSSEDRDLIERITDRNRQEADKYLAELKTHQDSNIETRVLTSSSVTAALYELVEKEGIDLVMLAAHGFTADSRWPYGSTVISFIVYGTTPLFIFQDLQKNRILPSQAEKTAKELGGR